MNRFPIPTGKNSIFKRIGYALIALALAILFFLASVPNLNLPNLRAYCLLMVAMGGVLIVVHQVFWVYRSSQLRDRRVFCMRCGWQGLGSEVLSLDCCPECEEDDIRMF